MNLTKLFIWMENLRGYATENFSILTGLINAYIKHIPGRGMITKSLMVTRISGVLARSVSVEVYRKHLEEKYVR